MRILLLLTLLFYAPAPPSRPDTLPPLSPHVGYLVSWNGENNWAWECYFLPGGDYRAGTPRSDVLRKPSWVGTWGWEKGVLRISEMHAVNPPSEWLDWSIELTYDRRRKIYTGHISRQSGDSVHRQPFAMKVIVVRK